MVTIGTLNGGNITITTGPAIDPTKTRFTLEGGTVEEYNIEGTLDQNWLDAHGFWTWAGMYWEKNIISIEIGSTVTSIEDSVFTGCSGLTSVTFEGKDKATVQGMTNYPFGLNLTNENGVTVHCTDGDIQVQNG